MEICKMQISCTFHVRLMTSISHDLCLRNHMTECKIVCALSRNKIYIKKKAFSG